MIWAQLLVVLLFIYLGARLGGIGIGFMGGWVLWHFHCLA